MAAISYGLSACSCCHSFPNVLYKICNGKVDCFIYSKDYIYYQSSDEYHSKFANSYMDFHDFPNNIICKWCFKIILYNKYNFAGTKRRCMFCNNFNTKIIIYICQRSILYPQNAITYWSKQHPRLFINANNFIHDSFHYLFICIPCELQLISSEQIKYVSKYKPENDVFNYYHDYSSCLEIPVRSFDFIDIKRLYYTWQIDKQKILKNNVIKQLKKIMI